MDVDYPDELSGLRKIRRVGDVKGLQVIGTFARRGRHRRIADPDLRHGLSGRPEIPRPQQRRHHRRPGQNRDRQYPALAAIRHYDKGEVQELQPRHTGLRTGRFRPDADNKYYQNFGERKYSNVLRDGLPNGNPHPILRASTTRNNFEASDYWVVDGGYFKLRNVELGYTLPHRISKKIGLNVLKIYVRGTNLFTISKIKDLDPECLNAGIADFPLFTTITGGVTFSF